MGNQSVGQTLLSLLIAMTLIVTLTPIGPTTAHAAESPDTAQFADKGDLMQFNTNDADGTAKAAKVYFGQNGPSDAQAWWIAGSQSIGSLTLFAASQLGQTQVFQQSMNAMPYNAEWGCVYQGETPTEVFPNHYGASKLREALRDAESSFFTGAEQALMKTSTIYTNDTKNNSVYSTILQVDFSIMTFRKSRCMAFLLAVAESGHRLSAIVFQGLFLSCHRIPWRPLIAHKVAALRS